MVRRDCVSESVRLIAGRDEMCTLDTLQQKELERGMS